MGNFQDNDEQEEEGSSESEEQGDLVIKEVADPDSDHHHLDESAGEYVDLDGSAEQTMDFANLSTTINKYRNAAIRDIRNGGEHDGSIDREFKFYDGI